MTSPRPERIPSGTAPTPAPVRTRSRAGTIGGATLALTLGGLVLAGPATAALPSTDSSPSTALPSASVPSSVDDVTGTDLPTDATTAPVGGSSGGSAGSVPVPSTSTLDRTITDSTAGTTGAVDSSTAAAGTSAGRTAPAVSGIASSPDRTSASTAGLGPGSTTAGSSAAGPGSPGPDAPSALVGATQFGGGLSALSPVPAPNLAMAEQRMAAQRLAAPDPLLAGIRPTTVQTPALAAAETSAGTGTALFGIVPRDAIPAILTVVATAALALVGGGNVRVWQVRRASTA